MEVNFYLEVVLVIKTSIRIGSLGDRNATEKRISDLLKEYEGHTCSIYLLHGNMSPEEISALYKHPKIKAFVGLAHGEGFGLPLFEAAYNSLPIITPGWGGPCDFLYVPQTGGKLKPAFAEVNYDMAPVQKESHWEGVIVPESMWCYPHQGHYKMRLRQVRKNHPKWRKKAEQLSSYLRETFDSQSQYNKFVDCINQESRIDLEVNDMFNSALEGASS